MRHTRIVCTLGPSSCTPSVLRRMVAAGMDVARFNFSHGDEASQRSAVEAVRMVAAATGRHIALMQDLQGPKIRTGKLRQPLVRLARGKRVTLTSRPVVGDESLICISHVEVVSALRPRDRVLLADGQIELRVQSTGGEDVECTIVQGGLLGERKGVAVPGRSLDLPAFTEKDLRDLRLGAELKFDYTALSFVRNAEDVRACRRAMAECGVNNPVIAKLERAEALHHVNEILASVDAVMVARGDLGVELSLGEVPAAQKDIIDRANRMGVPAITATEMLESMVTSNRPTRAEASDVANAIWDGTDAVMLSQETSTGAHPVEAVQAMARICMAAEHHPSYQRERPVWQDRGSTAGAMAHAAATVAGEVKAKAVIAFTESGMTARQVSKAHPQVPIVAASPHANVLRLTALFSGVLPLQVEHGGDTDTMIDNATRAACATGLVRRGDRVVLVAGVPVGEPGQTNLVKVSTIP
ncbi:MAG TPA: pyruvate kinase [Candidatus Dormibacteraeota bacterium]|nr:pyruvate kinase [Candidatus Dormibacteraeota bacterium]